MNDRIGIKLQLSNVYNVPGCNVYIDTCIPSNKWLHHGNLTPDSRYNDNYIYTYVHEANVQCTLYSSTALYMYIVYTST